MGWMAAARRPEVTPPPTSPETPGYFADVTAASGIDHTYRNGQEADHFAILESLGGGVALIDYDGDGLLDVFLTGGGYFGGTDGKEIKGHPCRLYKNLGNFKFKDVTAEVGLDKISFYTHGAAVGDYDRDGWPDLLVTGWGRLALFRNVADPAAPGGRRFVDVTERARLTDKLWSSSAAWGDLDGDGWPDLYVCHYVDWSFAKHPNCAYRGNKKDVCPPREFKALPHTLYRNNGDGTFTDVGEQAGLYQRDSATQSKGLGVLLADVDDDGRNDIYVANDEMNKLLYLNKGGLKFEEVGVAHGAALDDNGGVNGSMGVDGADYDGSGRLSLWVTNYQNEIHGLYRNRGGGQFLYVSKSAGIAVACGTNLVGFGTGFLDFDRDGAEDLFVANGHVIRFPPPPGELQQRPLLLRNGRLPGQKPHEVKFANVSAKAGPFFAEKRMGRGVALGDLDNDGRTDVIVGHLNEPAVVLRNRLDNGNHWLGIELRGERYRDLVGAKLTLDVDGQILTRWVKGGGSYLSAHDHRLVFGLGKQHQPGQLTVRWPGGKTQTWNGLAADRYWRLTEGERDATPPPWQRP